MARVTTKELTPVRAMSQPVTAPIAAPAARHINSPTCMGTPRRS